jgi:hypothetical protein
MPEAIINLVERSNYEFYHYNPIKWVSVHYALYFLLALGVEIYLIVSTEKRFKSDVASKHRRRYVGIMVPLMIGITFEAIGYIARAKSSSDREAMMPYVIQSVMLLIAPAFIVATIYMCLGEIIRSLKAEEYSVIPLKYLTKIFVSGDVLSFLMQSSGGGMMAKGQNSGDIGKKLIVIGLFVQVAFFGCFIIVMSLFVWRIYHRPTPVSSSLKRTRPAFGNWKHGLTVLVISSIFIFVRSVYRIVEYLQGTDGYLQSHEVFLFAFDSVLIFVSVVMLLTNNFTRFFCSAKAEDSDFDNDMYPLR